MEATIVDDTALEGTEQFFIILDRGAGVSNRIRIGNAYKTTINTLEDNLDGMLIGVIYTVKIFKEYHDK